MKLLKALWNLLFDHRTGLLLSGAILILAVQQAFLREWADCAISVALGAWGIWSAWPKLAVRT